MAGARSPKLGRMAADMDKIDVSVGYIRVDYFHESSTVTTSYAA